MLALDFAGNVAATARTYAGVMPNYALAGRLWGSGQVGVLAISGATVASVAIALWRARTVDHAFAVFSILGLLVAPLAWSQHLVIGLLAVTVALAVVERSPGTAALALWALAALGVSLPDPAVALLSEAIAPALTTPWPLVPFVLSASWTWLVLSAGVRTFAPSPRPPEAAGAFP